MAILEFKSANCKNCYKCLRECPVKAIKITDNEAKIIEDYCILCGKCTKVCTQNAKVVSSSIESVTALLESNKKVVASIAPSFIANFPVKSFHAFKNALQKLGFTNCFETAEGAKIVTNEYQKLINSNQYSNIISSACPTVVSMVRKYYPNALKYLAPIDSPMVAHAKLLHKLYGDDLTVVFIGPCIAKKKEALKANELNGKTLISDVLTFEELKQLLESHNITFDNNLTDESDNNRARYYAINRGIIKSFPEYNKNYEYISVDGITNTQQVLSNIDDLSGVFFEMNACDFSCVNGPASTNDNYAVIKAVEKVRKYTRKRLDPSKDDKNESLDLRNNVEHFTIDRKIPSEDEIKKILAKINKFKPEDELNCAACGYKTCRDKAIAVYNDLSNIYTCLPYMKEMAEKMNQEVIYYSPNGIISFDEEGNIININKRAKEIFAITTPETTLGYFRDYLPWDDLSFGFINRQNIIEKQSFIEKTKRYVEFSLIFVKEHHMSFCLIKDITQNVEYQEQILKNKIDLVETTNQVIEKQMRVVQEIASLLGETTAETKVALIHLRDQFIKDGE